MEDEKEEEEEEEEENNLEVSKSAVNIDKSMSEKSGDDIKDELERKGSSIAMAAGVLAGECNTQGDHGGRRLGFAKYD